jgi:hypothetical protein
MISRNNGIPLALGAAGLLAAAGLLRKRGSLASDPKARAQHFRRLLEPGSGAAEAEQDFARRSLELIGKQKKPPSLKIEEWGLPIGGSKHHTFQVCVDGKQVTGRGVVNPRSAKGEFDTAVRQCQRRFDPSSQPVVELRESQIVYSVQPTWDGDGPALPIGWWHKDSTLEDLWKKLWQLTLIEAAWDDSHVEPEFADCPFDMSGGLSVWMDTLVAFDGYGDSGYTFVAPTKWSSKDRDFRPYPEETRPTLWFSRKVNPDTDGHRQSWTLLVADRERYYTSDVIRKVDLGSDPMNIYDALFLFEDELRRKRPLAAYLEYGYTVKRYGPNNILSLPSRKSGIAKAEREESIVREILHPAVETLRRDVSKLAASSSGAAQDRLRSVVIPFLSNAHAYDEWFDRITEASR